MGEHEGGDVLAAAAEWCVCVCVYVCVCARAACVRRAGVRACGRVWWVHPWVGVGVGAWGVGGACIGDGQGEWVLLVAINHQ